MLFTKLNLHKLEASGISDRRANMPDFAGKSSNADLLYDMSLICIFVEEYVVLYLLFLTITFSTEPSRLFLFNPFIEVYTTPLLSKIIGQRVPVSYAGIETLIPPRVVFDDTGNE